MTDGNPRHTRHGRCRSVTLIFLALSSLVPSVGSSPSEGVPVSMPARWTQSTIMGLPQQSVGVDIDVKGNPEIEIRSDLRIGVCVTGQITRLELESKVHNLIDVNLNLGVSDLTAMDIVMILAPPNSTHFVNEDIKSFQMETDMYETGQDIRNYIAATTQSVNRAGLNLTIILRSQEEKPLVHQWHVDHLNKKKMTMTDSQVVERARSHVRQWTALSECMDEIAKLEEWHQIRYDVLVKIRDDSYILQPFNLRNVEWKDAVGVKSCLQWGGMNDKVAVMDRKFGEIFFKAPITAYYDPAIDWPTIQRTVGINNPESYLNAVFHMRGLPIRPLANTQLPIVSCRMRRRRDGTHVPCFRSAKIRQPRGIYHYHGVIEVIHKDTRCYPDESHAFIVSHDCHSHGSSGSCNCKSWASRSACSKRIDDGSVCWEICCTTKLPCLCAWATSKLCESLYYDNTDCWRYCCWVDR